MFEAHLFQMSTFSFVSLRHVVFAHLHIKKTNQENCNTQTQLYPLTSHNLMNMIVSIFHEHYLQYMMCLIYITK